MSFDYSIGDIKVGDRIVSKRIGKMIPSTVIGICPMDLLIFTPPCNIWDSYYEDWRNKQLVIVKFDEPVVYLTFEEVRGATELTFGNVPWKEKLYSTGIFDEIVQNTYENYPQSICAAYPIEDVEIFE